MSLRGVFNRIKIRVHLLEIFQVPYSYPSVTARFFVFIVKTVSIHEPLEFRDVKPPCVGAVEYVE